MRINTNLTASSVYTQYTKTNNRIASAVKKLSSGYAINSAADDPAGLAISEKMRAQIRGLDIALGNAQDAISLAQTADGGLSGISSILQRMNELAVQSASDTNQDKVDREALQDEFKQLLDEIDDIVSSTNFNKKNLLDGSISKTVQALSAGSHVTGALSIQIGPNAGDVMSIDIGAMDSASLGIAHAGVATREAASETITAVGNSIDLVSRQRASIGADENCLNIMIDNITTALENLTSAESRIRNVDIAKEMTELATAEILHQVNTAMLAQANAQPKDVLYLLKSY